MPRLFAQAQPEPPNFSANSRNPSEIVIGAALVVIVLVTLNLISRWMIRICRPNEMLVVTGSHSNQGQQGVKGYRVVANGGWTFVKPILETARRIDVTLLPVVVEVNNAYSHGGTPLNIQAIANVKVSSDPAVRNNAIERFLGRDSRAKSCRWRKKTSRETCAACWPSSRLNRSTKTGCASPNRSPMRWVRTFVGWGCNWTR